MQDDAADEFERADGDGPVVWAFDFEFEECRCVFIGWEILADAAQPVYEGLIGESALAAEGRGALVGVLKISEDTGLLFVGAACA